MPNSKRQPAAQPVRVIGCGMIAREILDVPSDFYYDLGLGSAVSPLRLRGMAGMLGRIKAQVRAQVPDTPGA